MNFNRIYWFTCAAIFIVVCLRAFFIPFSHDEAATFFFYIQSDNYLPYSAHVYTNNHVLNSALANICYHIAGSHRFVLRLPNILAFILLCIGIFRHFTYLKNNASKALLAGIFLFTFNFLDFFELCRGYGLSMGLLMLSLSYLMDYFKNSNVKELILFSVFLQMAIAANLILVSVSTVLFACVYLFQFNKKTFFTSANIILQFFNLALLIFWIKFSFFYKESGMLDYGVGNSYWDVTFKTLLLLLFGTDALWLQVICILLFVCILFIAALSFIKSPSFASLFSTNTFYPLLFIILIISFYLQKKILHVNYPEDRTGLFYFLIFGLSIAFVIDTIKLPATVITTLILFPLLLHFLASVNLSNFTFYFYSTIPTKIYHQLEKEHEKKQSLFTIGGHRIRELNFAFQNYRGMLNPMDDSEEMQMNCDYYFALKSEKPYYDRFYKEIGYDEKWDRVLLERRKKIDHKEIYNLKNFSISGAEEFFEIKRIKDSTFKSKNPIEIYAEINFIDVPKPFNGFLVLQINNEKGEQTGYKRIPLNWLDKNLNGKTRHLKLTSANLSEKNTIVIYIWNCNKEKINIQVKNLDLYQLEGTGVNFRIPSVFYTLITNITKKPLL